MNKVVVVVFPDEEAGRKGVAAFEELHSEGLLTVHVGVLVARDADGGISIKEREAKGPFGAAIGALLGGLIGLIGGPGAAVVGAAGGALMGGWRDVIDLGDGLDFADAVSAALTPGKSAIVAEISEEEEMPLDARMEAIGGLVLRDLRIEAEDERLRQAAEARKTELARLRAERDRVTYREVKATLSSRIEEVEGKLKALSERVQARLDLLRRDAETKLEALRQQAAGAAGEIKERCERRADQVRAEYERRSRKLKQALDLAKEALAP